STSARCRLRGEQAGAYCQQVQARLVGMGQVAAPQVQAYELWVKLVGRSIWMALAVPSRLWRD
ncbi:MAG: hypothetical protein ACO1SX_08470, partial [Actinomycetota bacterium]